MDAPNVSTVQTRSGKRQKSVGIKKGKASRKPRSQVISEESSESKQKSVGVKKGKASRKLVPPVASEETSESPEVKKTSKDEVKKGFADTTQDCVTKKVAIAEETTANIMVKPVAVNGAITNTVETSSVLFKPSMGSAEETGQPSRGSESKVEIPKTRETKAEMLAKALKVAKARRLKLAKIKSAKLKSVETVEDQTAYIQKPSVTISQSVNVAKISTPLKELSAEEQVHQSESLSQEKGVKRKAMNPVPTRWSKRSKQVEVISESEEEAVSVFEKLSQKRSPSSEGGERQREKGCC